LIATERLTLRNRDSRTTCRRSSTTTTCSAGSAGRRSRRADRALVRRWERNGVGQFIVELDGEIIGRVGFLVWDSRTWETSAYDLAGDHAETELGWAILSRHRGHGYATEAARAARASIESERIISLIHPDNVRSQRVAEKLGARPGERVETPGGPADVWVHPT
jgi:RimJ/RimL family protein N-acetyltransferase